VPRPIFSRFREIMTPSFARLLTELDSLMQRARRRRS
jgi:hypothetical protein